MQSKILKVKKGLSISTIVGVVACAVMLILTIFNVNFFEGIKGDILLTVATLTVGCFFCNSAINLAKHNKKIAFTGMAVIGLAVLLVIISIFFEVNGLYGDITVTIAMLSVLFNVIIYGALRLLKKYLYIQIPVYLIVLALCVYIILAVWGVVDIAKTLQILLVLIVLTIVGLITISVISNKYGGTSAQDNTDKDSITIKKSEYEMLVAKAKQLDEIMANKKQD